MGQCVLLTDIAFWMTPTIPQAVAYVHVCVCVCVCVCVFVLFHRESFFRLQRCLEHT